MSETSVIDVFVEDHAQEAFLVSLVSRLCRNAGVVFHVNVRTAKGGASRVLAELRFYDNKVQQGIVPLPDLLVVARDANCRGHVQVGVETASELSSTLKTRSVFACPDPHIERWYLLDAHAFRQVVGPPPRLTRKKCERDYYKRQFATSVRSAGHPPMLGGVEFAADLVLAMDLGNAGKVDPSLKRFTDDLTGQLRRLARSDM